MNPDHAARVIKAAHKLAALGLHNDYAELQIVKSLARLAEVSPEHVAVEIFEAAPAAWKRDTPAEEEEDARDVGGPPAASVGRLLELNRERASASNALRPRGTP